MNKIKQIEIYKDLDEKILEVASSKAHDYATEDVLNNFKSVSAAAKELGINVSDPTNYALFMVLLKIARISNLINNNKWPNNESVDDSFLDGINYMKLAYCNYKDKKVELDTDW
jgi:hypothetical protein